MLFLGIVNISHLYTVVHLYCHVRSVLKADEPVFMAQIWMYVNFTEETTYIQGTR